MEKQIEHFAAYLQMWAKTVSDPETDVAKWYRGEMPLPHPEWGPAEMIYQTLLRSQTALPVRNILIRGISTALRQLAEKASWSNIDFLSVLELLSSCRDFAPASELLAAVQKVIAHEKNSTNPVLISSLRQALIYNQDDDSLKGLWFTLLEGKKSACLTPAPLSDIKGVCRLGSNDNPALSTIAEGIDRFANLFKTSHERRTLLHSVWEDLAQAWNKGLQDPSWNWELIQAGKNAGWRSWVFETMPCLYGKLPGTQDHYFLWEFSAKGMSKLIASTQPIENIPVFLVQWKNQKDFKKIDALIRKIEGRRRIYSHPTSKGLAGIVFDVASRLSEPSEVEFNRLPILPVPSFEQQWNESTQVLCTAA